MIFREKSLLRACLEWLQCLENNGSIRWVDRLNSGSAFSRYVSKKTQERKEYRIRLCRRGTPDLYFIMNDGTMVWCECKASTSQRTDQIEFQHIINNTPHHHYLVVYNLDQLVRFISTLKEAQKKLD